jgi:hypothetical protein
LSCALEHFRHHWKLFKLNFKIYLGDSNLNLKFGHKVPSLVFSLSFFLILANRPRGGKDPLEIFLGIEGSSKTLYVCPIRLASRGKGSLMQIPLLNPSPSLISTRHRSRPPVDERHPSSTQTPTPSCRGTARALQAASAVAIAIGGCHA